MRPTYLWADSERVPAYWSPALRKIVPALKLIIRADGRPMGERK